MEQIQNMEDIEKDVTDLVSLIIKRRDICQYFDNFYKPLNDSIKSLAKKLFLDKTGEENEDKALKHFFEITKKKRVGIKVDVVSNDPGII